MKVFIVFPAKFSLADGTMDKRALAPNYRVKRVIDIYHLTLWIHSLYERGFYSTKLKHVITVDNYVFTYLPPYMQRVEVKETLLSHQQLIDDVIILTLKPKWSPYTEIRKGKVGVIVFIIKS